MFGLLTFILDAPLHREIIQEGNQVKKDHQVFAGLINVDSSYPIHASKDEAAEARKNGDTIKEEANGKTAHLVAYFDGDALVLHRTFVGETFEVLYIHRKNGDDTIELELHCINGDKTIKSSVVFSRHEHHHLPHLHHDKDKQ